MVGLAFAWLPLLANRSVWLASSRDYLISPNEDDDDDDDNGEVANKQIHQRRPLS